MVARGGVVVGDRSRKATNVVVDDVVVVAKVIVGAFAAPVAFVALFASALALFALLHSLM